MIEIKGLKKEYDGRAVIDGLTLTLPNAGTTCFLGPSGCGKTTLLHIMAGLIAPDGGSIAGLPKGKVSVVFQEDRLLPWATAEENVSIVAGRAAAEKQLRALGLSDALAKRPSELSGGMRRRVAIARALAFDGALFLLDEPLSGLDAELKREVIGVIREAVGSRPMFVITHDRAEAESFGGRIIDFSGPPLAQKSREESVSAPLPL